MRVGFVSILDASDVGSWSGIPLQILTQMKAQGADFELLSPMRTRVKYLLAPIWLTAKLNNTSVTLDHFKPVLRAYGRQIERFVRDKKIDVVFCPSTIPITLADCRKPIVTWTDAVFHAMHDYYSGNFGNMRIDAIRRGEWQEETALRNCSIAAYASAWAVNGARQITEPSKLRVLPFGSSLPVHHTFEEVVRSAKEKRARRKNSCELLFVGVNWQRKGGEIAVETARLLNEAGIETKLRVVGSKPPGELPSFVEVLGFISKNSEDGKRRLVDLFRSADIFILPTNAEAAGIVFAEASSCGLPCVTYATGGVTEYVKNGINGVCLEPGAPASRFADEIQRILENSDGYEALAAGAFREYEGRLNWKTSVRHLLQLCAESTRSQGSSK